MLRYKTPEGAWKRSPAASGKNGRVRPGHVLINGQVVPVAGGMYSIRHTEGRKTVYTSAGKKADIAAARCEQLERTKSIVAIAAKNPDVEVIERPERQTLKETASAYINDAKGRKALEAAEQARLVTVEFLALVQKRKRVYADQLIRQDIFDFHAILERRGCQPRTVANKHARLASWLTFAGVDKGLDRNDPRRVIPPVPKYEEKLPNVYSSDQVRSLLSTADSYMRICILLGLKCGLRDQELMHLEFSDFNWVDSTLKVQGKPRWGFNIKTWEQRVIPVPSDVLKMIEEWKQLQVAQTLILGTKNRNPNTKLLRTLKRLARLSGLNCGACDSCTSKNKECQEFTLHRFRRTYITTLLRNGIDLRTVQAYAGHKDLASTMRYLTPESGPEAQAKLNAVKW